MIFGGISNSGLPQHVLLGKNHGLNREFKDTLFQTDWVNINPLLSTTPVLFKNESFFFHVCQSEHITKDLLWTISVKNSRPWFAPNVKTSWGLSCAHIAPRGGFDLGQPALHGPWDEGWSNRCPFEVSQNSSAEAPNMYREVPRLPPSKIDVITKENYSKGFRSPPLQIAWNITRTVTNHLSSDPKISRVVEMIYPHAFGMFLHVFYHHFVSIQPHPTVPVPVPGQERVLRSLAQCGKPFAMLLPISVLHVGGEPWEPSIQRGDLEWILYLLYNIN